MVSSQARGLEPVQAFHPHPGKIAIIGGGPSIKEQWKEIRKFSMSGGTILAMNGVHDYLVKRKVIPWGMVMMDARPENADFVQSPVEGVRYLIASQCDPSVFDALPASQTFLWHVKSHADDCITDNSPVIGGGCTVAMKSMNIARMMGFSDIHLFGVDSCLKDGEHHAYEQKINDNDKLVQIRCGETSFTCAVWMVKQAQDFQEFCMEFGKVLRVQVHGQGLLSTIIDEAREVANG